VCKQYSDRMASWCDKGDKFCDAGQVDAIHGLYLSRYNTTMVQYVVERWQNSTESSATATSIGITNVSTGTRTASPTPSTNTASGLTALEWPLFFLSCGLFFI
jgi:hypothetical protein